MSNRQFMKIQFDQDITDHEFTSKSPINPQKTMIFMMDIKHNLKKIRNGILKSNGMDKKLMLRDKPILWEHFEEARDFNKTKLWKIHQKLKDEHFELNGSNKMRNKLAEDVLDGEMLYLVESLKKK